MIFFKQIQLFDIVAELGLVLWILWLPLADLEIEETVFGFEFVDFFN